LEKLKVTLISMLFFLNEEGKFVKKNLPINVINGWKGRLELGHHV